MNKNNMNVCNNCGKHGHLFYQCKLPITSYGIILFYRKQHKIENTDTDTDTEEIKILMIRRKDTFGYIDFIRGKYSPYNTEHIQNIVNEMSLNEKKQILEHSFDTLWKNMWGESANYQHKNEENASAKKFDIIKNGIPSLEKDKIITLNDLVNNSFTSWEETEWEFPKGRRDYDEKDLDCALREFEEETGIKKNKIKLIENIMPFEETFIGSNHKSYKHKFFLAYLDDTEDTNNLLKNYQKTEVSKIEWKNLEECLECIRPYHLEKKELVKRIYKVIQEYRLYT
jgi:8-oxo-dGTP pyrophosphatase MutT (NUDIX family)